MCVYFLYPVETRNRHGGQRLEVQHLRSRLEDSHRKQPHIPSYQQINCVDSIIRSDSLYKQIFLLIDQEVLINFLEIGFYKSQVFL